MSEAATLTRVLGRPLGFSATAHALFLAHPTVDALVQYLDGRTQARQTRVVTLVAWGSASVSWAAGAAGHDQLQWWALAVGCTALVGWQVHIHPLWRRAGDAPSGQLDPVSVAWSVLPVLALVAVSVWPALLFVIGSVTLLLGGAWPRSAAISSYLASVMGESADAPQAAGQAHRAMSPAGTNGVVARDPAAAQRTSGAVPAPVAQGAGNVTATSPTPRPAIDYGAELERLRATVGAGIAIDQLERGRTIGLGSYGKVVLVRHASSGVPYALKCLNRRLVVAHNQQRAVARERTVMAHVSHPFCARLVGTFKDATAVYLLLEWCPGGELLRHLPKGRGLPEPAAAFYVACAALALEHLHAQGVLYRDIKPENCLLDATGYLKLCDFGFAKQVGVGGVAHTVCGTPDFMAPEVVRGSGHTRLADVWSWGVLAYELVAGKPPFCERGAPPSAVYAAVLSHPTVPDVPHASQQFGDLTHAVLVEDPARRLGAGGWEEVKQHAWFRELDWGGLVEHQVAAPIVPALSSVLDTRHFGFFPDNAVALNDARENDDQEDCTRADTADFGDWDSAF